MGFNNPNTTTTMLQRMQTGSGMVNAKPNVMGASPVWQQQWPYNPGLVDDDGRGGGSGQLLQPYLVPQYQSKQFSPYDDSYANFYGLYDKPRNLPPIEKKTPLTDQVISKTPPAVKSKKKSKNNRSYWMMAAIGLFVAVYLLVDSNNDAFNLEEWLETILGEGISNPLERIIGYCVAFIGNLAMMPVILYCWLTGNSHHHDENWMQTVVEYLAIGLPFFLLGIAAFYDTLSKFTVNPLQWWCTVLAVVCGLVEGFAAIKLHGYFAHEVAEEHDGFFKGLYSTFFTTKHTGFKAVLDIWFSWGILVGHALLGYFAAASFVTQMTLAGYAISPVLAVFIKVVLTSLVTIFEGLSEAHSVKKLDFNFKQYSYGIIGFLLFCGFFHILPSITAGSWIVSSGLSSLTGLFGLVDHFAGAETMYNSLAMMVTAVLIWLPNWVGFAAMTAPTLNAAISKSRFSFFGGEKQDEDTAKNDEHHQHSHEDHHHHDEHDHQVPMSASLT